MSWKKCLLHVVVWDMVSTLQNNDRATSPKANVRRTNVDRILVSNGYHPKYLQNLLRGLIYFTIDLKEELTRVGAYNVQSPVVTTGVLISPQPDQDGSKLQRPNSNFCKQLKCNSEGCPSNQVSAAAMTSASDEKWRLFNCFLSRVGLRTYQHPCMYCNCLRFVYRACL